MSDSKLLELRGLCVSYGPVEAVHQVDLDVRADARMLLRQVLEAARDDAHHLGPLAFEDRAHRRQLVGHAGAVDDVEDLGDEAADAFAAAVRRHLEFEQHHRATLLVQVVSGR